MKEFIIENWSRKGVYELFRNLDFPFYHVSFRIDVTALKRFTKEHDLSFYYSLTYLVTKAANSVENFRLRFFDGKIYDVGNMAPSLAFLKPGNEAFQIVNCCLTSSIEEFTPKLKSLVSCQEAFIGGDDVPDYQLLYISCLPWMDVISSSSERHLNPDDAIPRITWGKYVEDSEGRLTLGMSVDVNHKVVDGIHIGKFYETLQKMIDRL